MVRWTGVNNFLRAADDFEEMYMDEVKRIIAETAIKIQSTAQALAPTGKVDGGNLKKSIEISFSKGGLKAEIIVGAFYGIYVEFGTGIYSLTGDGRKTPWVYYVEEGYIDENGEIAYWVFTHGMRAQPFWTPGFEAGMKHFTKEMNKLGA